MLKFISKWYSHGTHLQQLDYAIAHIDLIAFFVLLYFLTLFASGLRTDVKYLFNKDLNTSAEFIKRFCSDFNCSMMRIIRRRL